MRLCQGRLLQEVIREAMKFGGRMQWVKDMRMGLEAFGWQGLDMQALSGLSLSEVKHNYIEVYSMKEPERGGRKQLGHVQS